MSLSNMINLSIVQHMRHLLLSAFSARFRQIHRHPILVVGCSHSGTTLLLRIIGAHPAVYPILKETNLFANNQFVQLKQFDLEAYAAGKMRWAEKTPKHLLFLDRIFTLCPHAKVLLILRDGRDVALSLVKRGKDLESAAKKWVEWNGQGEKWWNDRRVKVLRYEQLVQDVEPTVSECLRFLELPFSEDCLRYYEKFQEPAPAGTSRPSETDKINSDYRKWQVSQPIFDGRKRWEKEMSAGDKDTFKKLAGEQLIRYGYATDMDW
jgi:hypothetical protein